MLPIARDTESERKSVVESLPQHLKRPPTDHRSRPIRIHPTIDWPDSFPPLRKSPKSRGTNFCFGIRFESKLRFAKAQIRSPAPFPEARFWLPPLPGGGNQKRASGNEPGNEFREHSFPARTCGERRGERIGPVDHRLDYDPTVSMLPRKGDISVRLSFMRLRSR